LSIVNDILSRRLHCESFDTAPCGSKGLRRPYEM
jgi:hypothetical protein